MEPTLVTADERKAARAMSLWWLGNSDWGDFFLDLVGKPDVIEYARNRLNGSPYMDDETLEELLG